MKYILTTLLTLTTVFTSLTYGADVHDLDSRIGIEMHEFNQQGDHFHIVYTVYVRQRAIARFRGMSLTPVLTDGSNEVALPSFVVPGANKERVLTRYYSNSRQDMPDFDIDWRTPNAVTYTITLPLQEWMHNAQLVIQREIQTYRARSTFDYFVLNSGAAVHTHTHTHTHTLYRAHLRVEMIEPAHVEIATDRNMLLLSGQALLDFPVGQSYILPHFQRNPIELARVYDVVRNITNNPDVRLQSIYISGFASPEGTAAFNLNLSGARANALLNLLRNTFDIPLHLFNLSAGGEDWDGLVRLLHENRVWIPNRDRIVQIIANEHDLDRREQQIRALDPNAWEIMLRHLFPHLRTVKYRIKYAVAEEGMAAENNNGTMSHHAMFQLAKNDGIESDNAYHLITHLILQHFPHSELAHSNAAALHIQRGNFAAAHKHLERAGNGATVLNNRGVLALLESDWERAEYYLIQAQAAGSVDAVYNRERLKVMMPQSEAEAR